MSTSNRSSTGRTWRLLAAAATGTVVAGALASPALAATTVTPATGGTAMTAANAGPAGAFTNLGTLSLDEGLAGEISTGRFAIMAPAGFEFRTTAAVTVTVSGSSGTTRPMLSASASCASGSRSSLSVTPTATAVTLYVCQRSTADTRLTIGSSSATGSIGVRPTASTPLAGGNLYLDGSTGAVTVSGITRGAGGTSLGTLAENPGPTSQFALGLPATVTAGDAHGVTVTARDAYGNTTTGYRGTVGFTSTDPAAALPAGYTFIAADNGTHTFTGVVFRTAGARSLTATDRTSTTITGVGSTTVAPAAAAALAVTGIANPAGSGTPLSATVTARDAYGNLATGYRGTVGFTSTDPAAALPAGYTFTAADNGTHTFSDLVLRTAGNQGVSVVDGPLSGTQSPITVQPGALSTLAVSPGTATVDAGVGRAYTAQGRDAHGNSLGDVTAGTTFTIAPDGSCTANTCAATTVGPHTVTATRDGATGTAQLQVNPAAPVVTVTLAEPTLVADGAATTDVLVRVTDAYGNVRTGDPVSLTTDGDAVLSAAGSNGDGTYTATLTASRTAGTQTITAANGTVTASAVLTQVAGPAAVITLTLSTPTLPADGVSVARTTVTVTDANGNPRAGDTVSLTVDGDVTVSAVSDEGFGTYTATVTASLTPGAQTLTAATGPVQTTAVLTETVPVTVTGVSPASRGQGANGGPFGQSVTITGNGFTPGTGTDLGPGVTVKFTTVVDAAKLVAHVVVATDAAVGSRNVTVTTTDGGTATCTGCFAVVPGPSVTSVGPDTIGPGAQRTVTVTGANFAPGVRVGVTASGVAVTSVTVLDAGRLSVALSTSGVAAPGPRDLVVTNPADAGSTTCTGCLTVTTPPVVTDVTPAELGGGARTTVTVTGTNFTDGARVSFAGTGVGVLSQRRVDANTVEATVSVAGAATPGPRTVSVVNADGGRGSVSTAFAVTAAPTVAAISPASLGRGGSARVTITGTNFAPGATVGLSTGVTVTDVEVVDPTTITATVSVAATAGAGTRTVLLTNADFGKGSCGGCFRVA